MIDIIEILWRVSVTLGLIILLTRLAGLRSFSKMSGFDFAVTVAMGSVLAAVATTPDAPITDGLFALLALFAVQMTIAMARSRSAKVQHTVDNEPLLIMENGSVLHKNLRSAGMTVGDLHGKLREANAFDLDQVHAVIFEATGDVSVLHGAGQVTPALLEGVRR